MKYKNLGNTGLLVSELCLGAMLFGRQDDGTGSFDQAAANDMVARALEAGINFIDTANIYAQKRSEVITGLAMKNSGRARSDFVLATKAYGKAGPGPNDRGNSRVHLMQSVKDSLKRLDTDYIDLFQLHGFDPLTPVEETLRALEDLVRQGHVRYVGVSNWAAWHIMKALGLADQHGWARLASVQAYYSIGSRDLEREIVPLMQAENIGLMVWSPLAGGMLTGKFERDKGTPEGSRRLILDFPKVDETRVFDCVDAMRPMAEERGIPIARIALAWLLHQPHVTSVIVGARTAEQFADNIGAADVRLTEEELQTLDKVSALPPEYPGWMVSLQDADRRNT